MIIGVIEMSCNKIITITRQYGSGGHEIGEALAKKLGIGFYDKELISLAAKESGIAPEIFENVDEKASNSLLYSLSVGLYNYGNGFSSTMGDLRVNDKLYLQQHRIIKEKAENEYFVIVGRCADYILRNNPDVIKIFIYADIESRIKRAVDRHDIERVRAKQAVIKADKNRANYYSFYSGQKWGQADHFDLCLNSTNLSTEQAVEIISKYIEIVG